MSMAKRICFFISNQTDTHFFYEEQLHRCNKLSQEPLIFAKYEKLFTYVKICCLKVEWCI